MCFGHSDSVFASQQCGQLPESSVWDHWYAIAYSSYVVAWPAAIYSVQSVLDGRVVFAPSRAPSEAGMGPGKRLVAAVGFVLFEIEVVLGFALEVAFVAGSALQAAEPEAGHFDRQGSAG